MKGAASETGGALRLIAMAGQDSDTLAGMAAGWSDDRAVSTAFTGQLGWPYP